jgi:hypothetical protein
MNRESVSSIFNRIINDYKGDSDIWFVFCHPDFILNEDLASRLYGKDTESIYGPIGIHYGKETMFGQIIQTDGSVIGKRIADIHPVQILDELCLIAHNKIFQSGLRFDEQFKLHFYGSDICMQAYHRGFAVHALQIECQCQSGTLKVDNVSPDFVAANDLFKSKWEKIAAN